MKVPLSSKCFSPRAGGETRASLPSARELAGKEGQAPAPAAPRDASFLPAFSPPAGQRAGGLATRLAPAAAALLLSACAATQFPAAHQPGAPGFLLGLWHGFIFPIAWIVSLFAKNVAVYAVPNDGGWYDFGYFLGIAVFGLGARKSHVVYRDRIVTVKDVTP
jgi:hypothetical protein